jgi:hypothetical protein
MKEDKKIKIIKLFSELILREKINQEEVYLACNKWDGLRSPKTEIKKIIDERKKRKTTVYLVEETYQNIKSKIA